MGAKRWLGGCAAAVLVWAGAVGVMGQQGPAGAGGGGAAAPAVGGAKEGPVLRASLASQEAVDTFLKDIDLHVPFNLKRMTETLPFVGRGGLALDKPLGVVLMAGEGLQPQQMVSLAVPLSDKATPAGQLGEMGFKEVEGKPGIMAMGALHLKRVGAYALANMAGMDGVLEAIGEDPFAADYKTPGRLAVVSLNLAAVRAGMPAPYKMFFDKFEEEAGNGPVRAADPAMQKQMREKFEAAVGKLDRVALALLVEKDALVLRTWFIPTEMKAARKFPQPGFPAGVIAQMHMSYPNQEVAGWIDEMLQKMPADTIKDAKMTAEQKGQVKAWIQKAAKCLFGADAASVAVALKDGKPVVYLVNQYAQDVDMAGQVKALADEVNALSKQGDDDTQEMKVGSHAGADGKTVQTIAFIAHNEPQGFVEFVQNGRTVYMAISADEGKRVEALAGLPTAGEMTNLCWGNLDLGALIAADVNNQSPLANLPPDLADGVKKELAGKAITWSVTASETGKFMQADVAIPLGVVKQGLKVFKFFMGQTMGPGGPPPGMGPGGPGGPGGGFGPGPGGPGVRGPNRGADPQPPQPGQ